MKKFIWLLPFIILLNSVMSPSANAEIELCPMNTMQSHSEPKSTHDCCDDEIAIMQVSQHECQECNQCQSSFNTHYYLYLPELMAAVTLRQVRFRNVLLVPYPEPINNPKTPPIA